MEATPKDNAPSPKTDAPNRLLRSAAQILAEVKANGGDEPDTEQTDSPPTRLRVEVYDALAVPKGLDTVARQAERHGISRPHMYEIRAGRKGAGLGLAMKMAQDLGTTVETLFQRVAP